MKKLNLFEFKRIIRKIINEEAITLGGKEEIIKMDDKGNITFGSHIGSEFFKKHFGDIADIFKEIYHTNILLIEITDDDLFFNDEVDTSIFSNISRNDIQDNKLKSLIDKNKDKKIIIFHSKMFKTGEDLFRNYVKNDKLKYNVGFWLLHDIGHSYIDNEDTIQDPIRKLEDFFRRKIVQEGHPLKQNSYKQIVLFIAETMKITREYLKDFHSDDYTDTLQNLIFVKNLNELNEINFENFLKFLNIEQPVFHDNSVSPDEYFKNIRNSIKKIIEQMGKSFRDYEKKHFKNESDKVILMGVSEDKLINPEEIW